VHDLSGHVALVTGGMASTTSETTSETQTKLRSPSSRLSGVRSLVIRASRVHAQVNA
jgi:hypothetical protein